MPTPVDVTAVVVAHDGEQWLPDLLAALRALSVGPRRTVAVDTGSTDGTPALLAAGDGPLDRVLTVSRRLGYGAAVAAALDAERDTQPAASWLWLLHDDCAPAPDALEQLLAHAADNPSVALLGPKVLDWDDPRVLVEVGLTTDRAGHRETGLERAEYDQGQHDGVRDVLAVGTAGALVRRDVWDAVGGLDPALSVFRDDLDLGWRVNAAGHRVVVVPEATVRHARSATVGTRRLHAARGRPEAVDRRHALLVLLGHAPTARLPWLVLRLLLATVVRVAGFLLTRQPAQALDELFGAGGVLLRPGRLRAARRSRARTRTLPAAALRPLFASRRARARARADALGEWLSGATGTDGLAALEPGSGGPAGTGPAPSSVLRRVLAQPPVLLVLGLLVVALAAERSVLSVSGGVLAGGRLLGAPGGASDLWSAYAASWHPVSVGSAAPAPPLLAVLAALATVLLGKAWLAVDVLLLGSIPLAGATAYAATRRVVRHTGLRVWAAATWALLPVATGALAAGRLDAAAAQVGLPLLLVAGAGLLRDDPRRTGWRRAWAAGLGLAVLTAFAPTLWPLLAGLLLTAATVGAARSRSGLGLRRLLAAVLALAVPVVLLLPWSATLLDPVGRLLHGPGRQARDSALADPALPAWHLPLLSPGGAGLPPAWMTAGLLVAALAGLLRGRRRLPASAGWALALPALAAALLLARGQPAVPGTGLRAPAWPGTALQVAAAGLLLAALVGADGARTRLRSADFGARQLLAGLVALLAAAVPLLTGAALLARGADGPLQRGAVDDLPAFVTAELADEPGLRALVLRPGDGPAARTPTGYTPTRYTLVGADGPRLGDADTPPDRAQSRALDGVVADLLTARGSDASAALATRAVRYVGLPSRVAATSGAPLVRALDSQPGLVRRAQGALLLWQVTAPTARLTLLSADLALTAGTGVRGPGTTDGLQALSGRSPRLPAGDPGRLLVLSEADDAGWRATLDGRDLPRREAWGWATAFAVPAQGGVLEVHHAQGGRRLALALQALGLLVVAVLAGPGGARRRGLERERRSWRGRREA